MSRPPWRPSDLPCVPVAPTALALAGLLLMLSGVSVSAGGFSYLPAADLRPGTGQGSDDADLVFAPGMRFPIEQAPAYLNSQIHNPGGIFEETSAYPQGGEECDVSNFDFPWRDNFCETREWSMLYCPTGEGHQGQDIRAASCEDDIHWVVAAVDGTVTAYDPAGYVLYLTASDDGTVYRYLHMRSVQVAAGDPVVRGQRLGRVSNKFGERDTTVHLHFDISQNALFVPTYMSLVRAYESLTGSTGIARYTTGERVHTTAGSLSVRNAPGGSFLASQERGNGGVIIGGPQRAALSAVVYTWWEIQWDDGATGWSVDYLRAPRFELPDRVEASDSLTARDEPGGSAIGNQTIGRRGSIVGGPVGAMLDDVFYFWWHIEWDDGVTGWSDEFSLALAPGCGPPGSTCQDIDACTVGETCDAEGSCAGGALLDCDDGDACTADSCDAASGCLHEEIESCPDAIPSASPGSSGLLVALLAGVSLWWLKGRARGRARLASASRPSCHPADQSSITR